LSVDVPPAPTALPCHFDRRRPGYEGAGRITVGDTPYRASASVKARHDYGQKERSLFYGDVLGPRYREPRFRLPRVYKTLSTHAALKTR
jgi:hypothetical protein